jgi:hypothetical protein
MVARLDLEQSIKWLVKYQGLVPRKFCIPLNLGSVTFWFPMMGAIGRLGRDTMFEEVDLSGLVLASCLTDSDHNDLSPDSLLYDKESSMTE